MTLCESETGACGQVDGQPLEVISLPRRQQVRVLFVTDPICSHCWALEPAWRKLLYLYGDQLRYRHVYGGLLPRWEGFEDRGAGIRAPADVAVHWAEVADHYGQPIDPSVWLDDPLDSSYPACIAAHAARLLDPACEERYLRRIRQAVFLEARNIARLDVLADCAAEVGLGRGAFLAVQHAARGAFERDLQELRELPVSCFPTLIMQCDEREAVVLRATQPFARLEEALLRCSGRDVVAARLTASQALAAYESGTTREFAELLGLDRDQTGAALREAGGAFRPLAGDGIWAAPLV